MQKIIIKHLKGSKTNQTETFELPFTELIIGRDSSANIKIDEGDDRVSRNHAKIILESGRFKLQDLNSTNGTFVNGKRIQGAVFLNVGDIVKLGDPGVEFNFDMDPRPENTAKATRYEQGSASQTREQAKSTQYGTQKETEQVKASIGRATVERLLSENTSQTRKKMINVASGILVIVILGASFLLYHSNKGQETLALSLGDSKRTMGELEKKLPTGITAAQISKQYSSSTVLIEASWKLFLTETGEQLFHVTTCYKKKSGKIEYIDCNNPNAIKLPAYIQTFNNAIEPLLSSKDYFNDHYHQYTAIGGFGRGHKGSGFVVKENGFILTNRHVAAAWDTRYHWVLENFQGLLLTCLDSECNKFEKSILKESDTKLTDKLKNWVPSNTITLGGKPTSGKYVVGRNDYLDVTFPNTRIRIPATLVRASDIADVALIKIDTPDVVTPVIIDSETTVQPGEEVTITGYPMNSPDVDVRVKSQDPMNRSNEWSVLPVPTISTGTVGKIISGDVQMLSDTPSEYRSRFGDVYQLNVNTTGEGNSGGPVFNDAGHVIGLYTYGADRNSFAVPIKYGEELMGIKAIK